MHEMSYERLHQIERMATYVVNVDGVNVKTTVTNRASSVDSYITELILSCDYTNSRRPIIGLDAEFNESDDSTDGKAATLQLCSGSRCIIIQLSNMEVIPQSLINLLSAPLFCFVGLGIYENLYMLKRDYGLECRNVVELEPFFTLAVVIGDILLVPKPVRVVLGNWGAGNLTMEQIESAATDAHIFCEIGKLLLG